MAERGGPTGRGGGPTGRSEAVERFLELRPLVRARMETAVPPELTAEFQSVTAHQLRALELLPAEDGLTMRQLAAALGVMGATVTELADRLVVRDLARREHDSTDRRVVRLVPTERGRQLADSYRRAQRQAADAAFDRLSAAQVATLLDVMQTLAAADRELEAAR